MASKSSSKLLVASIDFGTTFSGWAFLFKHQYDSDPTKVHAKNWNNGTNISSKTPTTILIKPDGRTLEAFGYQAEDRYAALAADDKHHVYYYFRRFKMMLFDKINLKRDLTLDDQTGKKLSAMTVFSLAISCLREDLLKECKKQIADGDFKDNEIHWVLTVPAIWNDAAKQFMREAAVKAGIPRNKLSIALEPEAASLFCKHLSVHNTTTIDGMTIDTFSEGAKYIILDAGGGTVDITVHEVLKDGALKELSRASGGAWGGSNVDDKFNQFLIKIFGDPIMVKFRKDSMDDYIDIFRNFEVKKRNVTSDNEDTYQIRLPLSLVEIFQEETGENIKEKIQSIPFNGNVSLLKGRKLQIDAAVMRDFFTDALNNTVEHIAKLIQEPNVRGSKFILMAGGFSESPILQETIKANFPQMNIIVPPEASLVVLKGAAIFGHQEDAIAERVSRYTYGVSANALFIEGFHPDEYAFFDKGLKRCKSVINKLIEIGETVTINDRRELPFIMVPLKEASTSVALPLIASTSKNPITLFDAAIIPVGMLNVQVTNMSVPLNHREFHLSGIFGQTEIHMEALELSTGKLTTATFDAL